MSDKLLDFKNMRFKSSTSSETSPVAILLEMAKNTVYLEKNGRNIKGIEIERIGDESPWWRGWVYYTKPNE